MFDARYDLMTGTHDVGNVRFLIEQQLALIEALDRDGRDPSEARLLLDRLLRADETLRRRMTLQPPACSRA